MLLLFLASVEITPNDIIGGGALVAKEKKFVKCMRKTGVKKNGFIPTYSVSYNIVSPFF